MTAWAGMVSVPTTVPQVWLGSSLRAHWRKTVAHCNTTAGVALGASLYLHGNVGRGDGHMPTAINSTSGFNYWTLTGRVHRSSGYEGQLL